MRGRLNFAKLVSYLTPVSDLDLAPPTDQFVASPPVRYITPRCYVKIFQKSKVANSVEFDYDGHICSLENFCRCLWTP